MVDSAYPVLNVPERYRNLANLKAGAYDAAILRLAIAISDVFLLDGVASGGGGSGGITQAQVQAAIDASSVTQRLMPPGVEVPYIGDKNLDLLKSTPGNIYSITVSNNNSGIRWFQVFDKNTQPQSGDIPVRVFPVPPDNSLLIIGQEIIGGNGIVLNTGIAWGLSSTRLTFTPATPISDGIITVRYA